MNSRPNTMPSSHFHFYIIVLGLSLMLFSNSFLTEGIGIDGLENGVIAKHFAKGDGLVYMFDNIQNRDDGLSDSKQYLPLSYYIESLAMQWFNDSYLFDKIYSVTLYLFCVLLVLRIWKLTGNSLRTGWLPLFFCICAPVVGKSATANLVEGPLTVFMLLTLISVMRSYDARRTARSLRKRHPEDTHLKRYYVLSLLWDVSAALFMVAGFFVRGVSAFNLILAPLVFWIFGKHEKIHWPIFDILVFIAVWAITGLLIIQNDGWGKQIIIQYFEDFHIMGSNHTVASHFYILWALVKQMYIALIVMFFVCIALIRRNNFSKYLLYWKHMGELNRKDMHNSRLTYRFIVLGLILVIPITISLKQEDHYLLYAIPFIAIGCACFVNNIIAERFDRIPPKWNRIFTFIAFVFIITGVLSNLNSITKISRDNDIINDMHAILPSLQPDEVVASTPEIMQDKRICYYFYRYKGITFDSIKHHPHFISLFSYKIPKDFHYQQLELGTKYHFLYEHVERTNNPVSNSYESAAIESTTDSIAADSTKHHPIF